MPKHDPISILTPVWLFMHRMVALLAFCGLAIFLMPHPPTHAYGEIAGADTHPAFAKSQNPDPR